MQFYSKGKVVIDAVGLLEKLWAALKCLMNKYPFVRHEAALYRSIKIQVYKLNRHKKFANPIFGSILAAVFRHACSP